MTGTSPATACRYFPATSDDWNAATAPAVPIASAYTLNTQRPAHCRIAAPASQLLSTAPSGGRSTGHLTGHLTDLAAGRFNARFGPAAGSHWAINVFPPRPVLTYHLLQCKSAPFRGHRTGQEALFPLNGGAFGGRRGETSVFASELSPFGRRSRRPDGNLRGGSGLNETVSPPISVR